MVEKTIIEFYADWCKPCEEQKEILDYINKNRNDVKVKRYNVETKRGLVEEYSIRSVPTLIILFDGNIVDKFVGLTQSSRIEKSLDEGNTYI